MQYLLTVIDGSDPAACGSGPADEEAAIDTFNERLQAEGHFAGARGVPNSRRVLRRALAAFVAANHDAARQLGETDHSEPGLDDIWQRASRRGEVDLDALQRALSIRSCRDHSNLGELV